LRGLWGYAPQQLLLSQTVQTAAAYNTTTSANYHKQICYLIIQQYTVNDSPEAGSNDLISPLEIENKPDCQQSERKARWS